MGEVYKIERENKELQELIKCLTDNKHLIKDVICIIRSVDGDMNLLDNSSFETKCAGSKLLDFMINEELFEDNIEEETEEEKDNDKED